MKGNPHRRGVLPILAVLVTAPALLAPVASADDGSRQPVSARAVDLASAKVFSTGIDIAAKVRYERAILTVSGMGLAFTREFDSHSVPSIGFFDPEGQMLPDGTYSWELKLVPDAVTAQGLRESAERNGGEAERPWLPKTGSFAIRAGAFAMPDVFEEGAQRPEPEAARRGVRREVASREVIGQAYTEKAASASDAMDTDMAVAGGLANEKSLRAGGDTAPRTLAGNRAAAGPAMTGPDSDSQALATGVSIEKALRTPEAPRAAARTLKRTKSADGKNGRPRDDR